MLDRSLMLCFPVLAWIKACFLLPVFLCRDVSKVMCKREDEKSSSLQK